MQKYLVLVQGINKAKFFMKLEDSIKDLDNSIEIRYVAILPGAYQLLRKHGKEVYFLSDLINRSKNYKKINFNYSEFSEFEIARHSYYSKKFIENTVEDYLVSFFFLFEELFKPTHIFFWNCEEMHNRVMKYVASNFKIYNIYHFENGFFPNTMVVDSKGVNNKSSLKGFDFYSVNVNQNKLEDYITQIKISKNPSIKKNKLKNTFNNYEIYLKLKELFIGYVKLQPKYYYLEVPTLNIKQNISTFLEGLIIKSKSKLIRKEEIIKYEVLRKNFKRIVFVPLQVPDDTQVLVNSDWIRNIEQFISVCINNTPKDVGIVFKTHPAAIGKHSFKSYKQICNNNNRVLLTHFIDTYKLIEECNLVITINSTVGLESMLFKKPIIALGNGFWTERGIVNNAIDEKQLKVNINNSLSNNSSYDYVNYYSKILYKIIFEYLISINFKNPKKEELLELAVKIKNGYR